MPGMMGIANRTVSTFLGLNCRETWMSDIYPGLLGARSIHANYLVTRNDPNSAASHGCADPVGCKHRKGVRSISEC